MEPVGTFVLCQRQNKGISQCALAKLVNLNRGTIGRIERGQLKRVTRGTARKLARVFVCPAKEILRRNQPWPGSRARVRLKHGRKFHSQSLTLLAKRLRGLRQRRHISVRALARAVHRSPAAISDIELGITPCTNRQTVPLLYALAGQLQVEPEELLSLRPGRKLHRTTRHSAFTRELTTARLAVGLSQAVLARRARVSRPAYNNYERGHSCPTAEPIKRIKAALVCAALRYTFQSRH